jgi:hypothetical protein
MRIYCTVYIFLQVSAHHNTFQYCWLIGTWIDITKLGNDPVAAAGSMMMVNTKCGAFDNARKVLPMTPLDNKVDRKLINPRFQAQEKFILGMYLGEVTRNLLLTLIDADPSPSYSMANRRST